MRLFTKVKEKDFSYAGSGAFTQTPGSALAASLFQATSNANNELRLIGLTSTHRKEGVTTVTSMLVQGLDKYPTKKLLLVDAALHNPKIHALFGTNQQPGFTDLISKDSLDPQEAILPVGDTEIMVMPSGAVDLKSTAPFLTRVQQILDALRDKFDMVVIDLPPAGDFPEFVPLMSLLDGIVYVVEAHRTRTKAIRTVLGRLRSSKVNIIGGVLNRKKYYIPKFIYEMI
ncbi:tyrosine-protein kinase family protein [Thermodesulforhabdus norvegica]|uniref:Chromosome partitioning ATPase, Mrp family, contains Fe-S cluster n=1 Tax=Thermodesulforhabdus norvegica TaxID=39841 RepID=A0A1I4WBE2_9BACT|nr:CpsD/CapB family tyrosine-protein kinase [Thermodesulforhabdus norvegica]SFN11038.1 Chromosome partitioning ATPase, Mrp family, contains Fe-S cluster [Thermodesulforhabdus norvegica]